jgi:hypothetical protein
MADSSAATRSRHGRFAAVVVDGVAVAVVGTGSFVAFSSALHPTRRMESKYFFISVPPE